MQVKGRFGGRFHITWEDRIEEIGGKHRRTMAEMRIGKERSDRQKWIKKKGHPDI